MLSAEELFMFVDFFITTEPQSQRKIGHDIQRKIGLDIQRIDSYCNISWKIQIFFPGQIFFIA